MKPELPEKMEVAFLEMVPGRKGGYGVSYPVDSFLFELFRSVIFSPDAVRGWSLKTGDRLAVSGIEQREGGLWACCVQRIPKAGVRL